jgi:1-acyl-sn-glycerol-3-phosphate acyltransferase
MAWEKAFEWFLIGGLIRYLGAFPVNLERGTKQAFKEALKSLRDGATLIIFPEGEREFSDGKLLPFKPGAVKIAMTAGVPILPVTVRGAHKIWAQDMKLPRLGKVEIFYHPPFEVPPPGEGEDEHLHLKKINRKLEEIIGSRL